MYSVVRLKTLIKTDCFYPQMRAPSDMILIYVCLVIVQHWATSSCRSVGNERYADDHENGKIAQFLLPLLGSDVHRDDIKVQVVPYHNYKSIKNSKKPVANISPLRNNKRKKKEKDLPVAVILAEPKYMKGSNNISSEVRSLSLKNDHIGTKSKFPKSSYWESEEDEFSEDDSRSENSNESSIIIHLKRNKDKHYVGKRLEPDHYIHEDVKEESGESNYENSSNEGEHKHHHKKHVNSEEHNYKVHKYDRYRNHSDESRSVEDTAYDDYKNSSLRHYNYKNLKDSTSKSSAELKKNKDSHTIEEDKTRVENLSNEVNKDKESNLHTKDNNFTDSSKESVSKPSEESNISKHIVFKHKYDQTQHNNIRKHFKDVDSSINIEPLDALDSQEKTIKDTLGQKKEKLQEHILSFSSEEILKYKLEHKHNELMDDHHDKNTFQVGTDEENNGQRSEHRENNSNKHFEYTLESESSEVGNKHNAGLYNLQGKEHGSTEFMIESSSSEETTQEKYDIKQMEYRKSAPRQKNKNKNYEKIFDETAEQSDEFPSRKAIRNMNKPHNNEGYNHREETDENYKDKNESNQQSEVESLDKNIIQYISSKSTDSSSSEEVLSKTNNLDVLFHKKIKPFKNYNHNILQNKNLDFSGASSSEEIVKAEHIHGINSKPNFKNKNQLYEHYLRPNSESSEQLKLSEEIFEIHGNNNKDYYLHVEHGDSKTYTKEDEERSTEISISKDNEVSHLNHHEVVKMTNPEDMNTIESEEVIKEFDVSIPVSNNDINIVHYFNTNSRSVKDNEKSQEVSSKQTSDEVKDYKDQVGETNSQSTEGTDRSKADLKDKITKMVVEESSEVNNQIPLSSPELSTEYAYDNIVPEIVFIKNGKVMKYEASDTEITKDNIENDHNSERTEINHSNEIVSNTQKCEDIPIPNKDITFDKRAEEDDKSDIEVDLVTAKVNYHSEYLDEDDYKTSTKPQVKQSATVNKQSLQVNKNASPQDVIPKLRDIEKQIVDAIASYVQKKVQIEAKEQDHNSKSYNLSFVFNKR